MSDDPLPLRFTRKFRSSICGSISRNVPHPPPTALWMRTLGEPYDLRMPATVSATWLPLETSQIIAWVSGSSCSSARMRSGERARAMTRNPSAAKRRTIAEPVPGPTPVTMAIGLSDIDASPGFTSEQQDSGRHCRTKLGFDCTTLDYYHHITQLDS